MKYKIEEEKEEFKPITFTVTIENEAELKSWCARLNPKSSFDDDLSFCHGAFISIEDRQPLYNYLKSKLQGK